MFISLVRRFQLKRGVLLLYRKKTGGVRGMVSSRRAADLQV
jgi:hypothetical protein